MGRDSETIAFYDKEAQTYADDFSNSKESDSFRRFADLLPAGGAVLDLGCGAGNATRRLCARGFDVTAFDASTGMLAVVRQQGDVKTILADIADLDAVSQYDGIWANFSLQHIPRAELPEVLQRISTALKPGGYLHIGIHEGTETRRDRLGRLYCHHSEGGLRAALKIVGIKVLRVDRSPSTGYDGTKFTAMILGAQKIA